MPNTEQSLQETGGIPQITFSMEVSGMTQYPTDKTLSITDMPADAKAVGDEIAALEQAIAGIVSDSYPVGSVYMTTSNSAPTFTGTWVEIGITATWTQLKNGKHNYRLFDEGEEGGTVHFWLRTA